jgi:hypothetical protein
MRFNNGSIRSRVSHYEMPKTEYLFFKTTNIGADFFHRLETLLTQFQAR